MTFLHNLLCINGFLAASQIMSARKTAKYGLFWIVDISELEATHFFCKTLNKNANIKENNPYYAVFLARIICDKSKKSISAQ